ncbi:GTP-binding protein [Deinococcus frigens]|uniref:GTPase MglA n=1 Tax=Deinococcus frigens TaxID=249403 RepID=UPI000497C320|nr:ADP-ribosylation factor-like protein [Deinococcus frigens]
MSTINFAAREINCKIVYYGPGMSGKTTNLKQVFAKVPGHLRGEMVSLATEDERTLFFDFLPLDLGSVQGFKTRFHLYTVPGQVFYNASRKLILRGVDGIVFVADSAPGRLRANAESMRNLRENLAEHGINVREVPVVLQVNKRDLPDALPTSMIRAVIDPRGELQLFEATSDKGVGVFETLKTVSRLVLERLPQPK